MHPSIKRAREILERRHIAEAEHEAWRAAHNMDEIECQISETRQARLVQKKLPDDAVIHKTIENALLPVEPAPAPTPQPTTNDAVWDEFDKVNKVIDKVVGGICQGVGDVTKRLEIRIRELEKRIDELKR
jgi:hypothetical protein